MLVVQWGYGKFCRYFRHPKIGVAIMMTSKVKSLIAAIFLLSLCMYTGAKDQEINQTEAVFVSGSPITTSALSPEYDLTKIKPHGFFSLQVDLSAGDDITHIQVEVSNGGGIFSIATVLVEGTYTDKIFETFTTASGPGSDGVDSIQIGIPIARIIRFRLFSAGTSTVDVNVAIQ